MFINISSARHVSPVSPKVKLMKRMIGRIPSNRPKTTKSYSTKGYGDVQETPVDTTPKERPEKEQRREYLQNPAHQATICEKHWGTTQKYWTEEDAYGKEEKKPLLAEKEEEEEELKPEEYLTS